MELTVANLKHWEQLVHGPTEVLADGLHSRRVHLAEGVDDDGELLESGELGFDLLQSLDGVDEVGVPKEKTKIGILTGKNFT